MHSRIFQISKMWIGKENYLNEDTLHQGDGSFYDYCAEIDDEERKEDIRYCQYCPTQRYVRTCR